MWENSEEEILVDFSSSQVAASDSMMQLNKALSLCMWLMFNMNVIYTSINNIEIPAPGKVILLRHFPNYQDLKIDQVWL